PGVPPPAAPGGGAASPGAGGTGADRYAYADRVRERLMAEKRYPPRALRRGQQGVVMLQLTIAPDGSLAAPPRIIRSSGTAALDREALRMANAAAPFEPSGSSALTKVSVPVHFTLTSSRGGSS